MEWVDRSWIAMKPLSSKGAYINYLSADDPAAVKASYCGNYDRLCGSNGNTIRLISFTAIAMYVRERCRGLAAAPTRAVS